MPNGNPKDKYAGKNYSEAELEILVNIELLKNDVAELKDNSVSKAEFLPIKLLVYGASAMILTGVFGALIALVVI